MSRALVDLAAGYLESRTTRRGFLRRAAIVGSALAAAPTVYALRPGSAYSAITTTCANCSPGSRCCGGYTEFCCSMSGVNTCPPGNVIAGWWRAEGSGYCGGSRYYLDCNPADCGGCGCGASGTCGPACVDCSCGCANNNCGLRRTCCVQFRYGQCNQDLACIGPITCRVVTCVPPWEWDSSCTRTDARDQNTAFHDASCLHPATTKAARPGVMTGERFSLRNSLGGGEPSETFEYGLAGDTPLMADWSGSGMATAAVVRGVRHGALGGGLTWLIRQTPGAGRPELSFEYGRPGDVPVAGDWNGNGVATIGVVRDHQWLLRNSNSSGATDISLTFGEPGDIPVVGDWDGDGIATPGVVRGTTWILLNGFDPSGPRVEFDFGPADGVPVVGDWTGAGHHRPGRYLAGEWRLRNSLSAGAPDIQFTFGDAAAAPVVWGVVG